MKILYQSLVLDEMIKPTEICLCSTPTPIFGHFVVNLLVIRIYMFLDHVEICNPKLGMSVKQRGAVSDAAYQETH